MNEKDLEALALDQTVSQLKGKSIRVLASFRKQLEKSSRTRV